MPYYRTCPRCGCNLDPGERCDCTAEGLPIWTVKNEPADPGGPELPIRTPAARIPARVQPGGIRDGRKAGKGGRS